MVYDERGLSGFEFSTCTGGSVSNWISIGDEVWIGSTVGVDVLTFINATAVITCSPTATRRAININLSDGVLKSVDLIISQYMLRKFY